MTYEKLLERYEQIKRECPGSLVVLEIEDFFEAFGDDARTIAKCLGLSVIEQTEIGRQKQPLVMAGFPQRLLGEYRNALVAAGHRVACAWGEGCPAVEHVRELFEREAKC